MDMAFQATHSNNMTETGMPVRSDLDVLKARQLGKELASSLRFSASDRTIIATAISEIARNTVLYAKAGQILLKIVQQGVRRGILVVAKDEGPGIPDLDMAMQDGYTTSQGLGIGLPGAKRLMDEFHIESEVGKGTTITMKKWEK